jgi:hypothetical protein
MNCKGIERQIQKLVAALSEVSLAYEAEEILRDWRETGEFNCPDSSRVPITVYRQIIGAKG